MAKQTKNYLLNYLEQGDTWTADADQENMQGIENLLQVAEFFVEDGIVSLGSCTILTSATAALRQRFYDAAFDYFNPLYLNVVKCECQYINNEDVVADLVSISNLATSSLLTLTVDGSVPKVGQVVFLTNQTTTSQNGVYDITTTGAVRRTTQPKKVFINGNSGSYSYTIWAYDDTNKYCQNLCDCILSVDQMIAIQNTRAVTTPYTCYVRPSTSGSLNLLVYSPSRFYGTGTPILFMTANPGFQAVTLATLTTTATHFSRFYSISGLSVTASTGFLVDFSSSTYQSRTSFQNLHTHVNADTKLNFSNLQPFTLVPISAVSNSCTPYYSDGTEFKFDSTTQSVAYLFVNNMETDVSNVVYNSSLGTFDLDHPVSTNDNIIILINVNKQLTLVPLDTSNAGSATYIQKDSNASSAYKWSSIDYNNYQLYIAGKSISQLSYTVDNTTGKVTINDPNVSDLNAADYTTLVDSSLTISSSLKDTSSFVSKTKKFSSISPTSIVGKFNQRFNHNQFQLQQQIAPNIYVPLIAETANQFRIPLINQFGDVIDYQLTSSIDNALAFNNHIVFSSGPGLFSYEDGKLIPLVENTTDVYKVVQKIKRVNNAPDMFCALLSNGSTKYCLVTGDFSSSDFVFHEFTSSSTINDVSVAKINGSLKYFVATDTHIYDVDFSHLEPVFNQVFYTYTYSSDTYYSYVSSGATQLAISVYSNGATDYYELYAALGSVSSGGPAGVLAVYSKQLITTDTTVKVYDLFDTNGISDNGVVIINTAQCLVTTAPASATKLPLTYGSRIQISAADVTCKTGSIANITVTSGTTITNQNVNLLDATPISNDYILLRHQINATENGIYKVTSVISGGATLFSATKQALDNFAAGNYVLVSTGDHYTNSYWECDASPGTSGSTTEVRFRLRMTDFGSGFTGVTRVFTAQENTIFLSQPTSCRVVYDSSYLTKDAYCHQSRTITTSDQIIGANFDNNVVVTTQGILSDDLYQSSLSGQVPLSYAYPLSQGASITTPAPPAFDWKINQLIKFTNGTTTIICVVTNVTSILITMVVVSTNAFSSGFVTASSYNFTCKSLINNSNFSSSWYSSIAGITSGSYLATVPSSSYAYDVAQRKLTLGASSGFSGSALFGVYKPVITGILPDALGVFNVKDNVEPNNIDGEILGEFQQTNIEPYILDHSVQQPSTKPKSIVLTSEANFVDFIESDNTKSIVSTHKGNVIVTMSSGSLIDNVNVDVSNLIYVDKPQESFSLEDKLWNKNAMSSQTLTNAYNLDAALVSALSGYSRFSNSSDIQSMTIDANSASFNQGDVSDFEPGFSNYYAPALNDPTKQAVCALITVSGGIYAIGQGVVSVVSAGAYSDRVPLVYLPFNTCYQAAVSSSLIMIGTDNGLFTLDYNFNLVSHSCAGMNVTSVYTHSSTGFDFFAAENYLVCIKRTTHKGDVVKLDCDKIFDLKIISVSSPTVTDNCLLVGTNTGLFVFTLNVSASKQSLTYKGTQFLGGIKLTLDTVYARRDMIINGNTVAAIYNDLQPYIFSDSSTDVVAQPNILDIYSNGTDVYLSTDNGIQKYTNLYTLDLLSVTPCQAVFHNNNSLLTGQAVFDVVPITDATTSVNFLAILTTDGVYYTFDNFYSFIKGNLAVPTLSVANLGSTWYFGTLSGLYSTTSAGRIFSSENYCSSIAVSSASSLYFILKQGSTDYGLTQMNVPFYATAGQSYTFTLNIYNVDPITGLKSGAALATSALTATYTKGAHILKFTSIGLTMVRDRDYVFEIVPGQTTLSYFYFANSSNGFITVRRQNINQSTYMSDAPAVKLCYSATPGSTSISRTISLEDLETHFNTKASTSYLVAPYPYGDIEFIIDNSASSEYVFGSDVNLNVFVSTVLPLLTAKFRYATQNVVLTDLSLTNINAQSFTGSQLYSISGSVQSTRFSDALNAMISRANPTTHASGSVGPSGYSVYMTDLSNAERAWAFKNILQSSRNIPMATLSHTYNAVVPTATDIVLTQNGSTVNLSSYKTYIFAQNQYVVKSQYTISANGINFTTLPSGTNYDDVQVYFLSSAYPTFDDLTNLPTSGSIFSNYWSALTSQNDSKIIVVLSDMIDNNSVTSLSNYVSALNDQNANILVVLCAKSILPGTILPSVDTNVICFVQGVAETMADFATRVGSTVAALAHPVIGSQVSFVAGKDMSSFNVSFTGMNVFYAVKDHYSQSIMSTGLAQNSTNIITNQTGEEKTIEIFFNGSGSISSIQCNYTLPTNYFLAQHYNNTGSAYNGTITILQNMTNINSTSVSNVAASGTKITNFNPGWSYSPNATPNYILASSRMLTTGPQLTVAFLPTTADYKGLYKYTVSDTLMSILPIDTKFTLSTGPISAASNQVPLANVATTQQIASTVNAILRQLNPALFGISGSKTTTTWWDWFKVTPRGNVFYDSSLQTSNVYMNDLTVLYSIMPHNTDVTDPNAEVAIFDLNNITGYDDRNNFNYSAQLSLVNDTFMSAYSQGNVEYALDNTRMFKMVPTSESQTELSADSQNILYVYGDSSKGTAKSTFKIIKTTEFINDRVFRPSVPTSQPLTTTLSKFKSKNVQLFGIANTYTGAGRKLRHIDSVYWSTSGSTPGFTGASMLYDKVIGTLTQVSVNSSNTVGEVYSKPITSFTTYDDNFTPLITSIAALVNADSASVCGLNDTLTPSVSIDRNDGLVNSTYTYQFNTGDLILVAINWYGVTRLGAAPALLSSSKELLITQSIYTAFKGGYVYAEAQASKGYTKGTVLLSSPIYVV